MRAINNLVPWKNVYIPQKKLFTAYRYAELNDEELSKRRRRKRSVNSSDEDNLQYLNRIHLGSDVQKKHKESCKKILMTFIPTTYEESPRGATSGLSFPFFG